ncbi:MAG: hypothetical protein Q4P13_07315 [Psychrobacter sp.]|nr:hypothetical protein [Psychrobacter sp.]
MTIAKPGQIWRNKSSRTLFRITEVNKVLVQYTDAETGKSICGASAEGFYRWHENTTPENQMDLFELIAHD